MALVLKDNTYYVYMNGRNKPRKTSDINKAEKFNNIDDAVQMLKGHPGRLAGFEVYDTISDKIRYSRNSRNKRKSYSKNVRKMIYINAGKKCQLCGKKLLLQEMTLDHIVPLSRGGADTVDNIQCACKACNKMKGDVAPEDFEDCITRIFKYQMEKKYGKSLRWKIISMALEK